MACRENPHFGALGVPFRKSMMGEDVISDWRRLLSVCSSSFSSVCGVVVVGGAIIVDDDDDEALTNLE